MDGSWSNLTTFGRKNPKPAQKQKKAPPKKVAKSAPQGLEKYFALVVDSGAIIKHSGFSTLHNASKRYFTTQGVYDEIRDSKAREHLENLPFDLEIREPTSEGLTKVIEFSKKTGDYASLSIVDLHVLALLYDLEKEGCHNMDHIRTEPKRMLGIGRVTQLNQNEVNNSSAKDLSGTTEENEAFFFEEKEDESLEDEDNESDVDDGEEEQKLNQHIANLNISTESQPKVNSWAMIVNPSASFLPKTKEVSMEINNKFSAFQMTDRNSCDEGSEEKDGGGQFSDAEDDDSLEIPVPSDDESSDDGEEFASIGDDFSDEECDVYILEPEEVEEKKKQHENDEMAHKVEDELNMEFPSLAASTTIPYEGSDDESNPILEGKSRKNILAKAAKEDAKRRESSLKPNSKDGKIYNSFRNYKHVLAPGGVNVPPIEESNVQDEIVKFQTAQDDKAATPTSTASVENRNQSRVMGGIGMSGQGTEVDDDGEGWVTSTQEISAMKASGNLDPFGGRKQSRESKPQENLPSIGERTACATTDFAMQNVILQMNLELLSVDGVKVRKLKSWVQRCGACFKVYTENDTKRLFCDRCGSDSIQRIAASLDVKTGRLRLHLSKKYKNSKRGTQFTLPKPGNGNRFMGDLLLAEDQLMYGAWNQRVKKTKSKKEAESIFGADIASTVGCHSDLTKRADIKVGFGKKNPNASKFGRERRGKKKKNIDKACGLRRY